MKRFLVLLALLNSLDTWATLWLMHRIGWNYEINPVLRWLVYNVGERPMVAIKLVAPLILMFFLWRFSEEARVRWVPWVILVVYAFVPTFNLTGVVVLWGTTQ